MTTGIEEVKIGDSATTVTLVIKEVNGMKTEDGAMIGDLSIVESIRVIANRADMMSGTKRGMIEGTEVTTGKDVKLSIRSHQQLHQNL